MTRTVPKSAASSTPALRPILSPVLLISVGAQEDLPWITQSRVHQALRAAWFKTDDWLVGNYLLLPDRLFLFCRQRDPASPLPWWMRRWQQRFLLLTAEPVWQWQSDFHASTIVDPSSYELNWLRVQRLPIHRGLATCPAAWPHQGCLQPISCP